MVFDFSSIAVLLLMFLLLTVAMKLLGSCLPGFAARKLYHAGGGLICCYGAIICPTYREGCTAAFIALATVALMRGLQKLGVRSFLYSDSDEKSFGDVLFPLSVLFLAYITGIDRLTFILPVMIMSVADCLAACIGKSCGTKNLAGFGEDRKTAEGSLAFFTGAYAVTALCCTAYSHLAAANIIIISFIIALCLTMTELFSSCGTDNVMIPLTAYMLIKGLTALGIGSLVLTAAVLLLLFATSLVASSAGIATLYCALRCSVMWFAALVALSINLPLGAVFAVACALLTVFNEKAVTKDAFGVPLYCTVTCVILISNARHTYIGALLLAGTAIAFAVTILTKTGKRGAEIEAVGNAVVARG